MRILNKQDYRNRFLNIIQERVKWLGHEVICPACSGTGTIEAYHEEIEDFYGFDCEICDDDYLITKENLSDFCFEFEVTEEQYCAAISRDLLAFIEWITGRGIMTSRDGMHRIVEVAA